ncbi:MAG: Uma2 family endonuclease [Streptomycetaceae bacterium]|nr:Uma2 family endonuclease [Streptomycetaceae bacterium]
MTVMVERSVNIPKLLDDLDAPEGFRVEWVEGGYAVTPPPAHEHETIAASLLRQLFRTDLEFVYPGGRGYCMTSSCTDLSKGNHVIPDLAIGARPFTQNEIAAAELHENWLSADALDVVVEITSSNLKADTQAKVAAYGRMGIPYYLIVNRSAREVVLLSKPTGDVAEPGYADRQSFAFGQRVQLPDPYPVLKTTTWQ